MPYINDRSDENGPLFIVTTDDGVRDINISMNVGQFNFLSKEEQEVFVSARSTTNKTQTGTYIETFEDMGFIVIKDIETAKAIAYSILKVAEEMEKHIG